jgi:DNA-binding transcriptional LysR family regulator
MAGLVRHRSDLSDLHVFYAVATCGGLNAAARALRVDPSTVTRTLDQLELRLNAKLVRRTSQGVTLTRAGEMALQRVRTIEHLVAELEAEIIDAESVIPEGRVTIACPDGVGAYFVTPGLVRLVQENPKLDIGLDCGIWQDYPLRSEAEVVITYNEPMLSDTIAKELAHVHYALFASRKYLDLYGVPTEIDQFMRHPFIHHAGQTPTDRMSARVPAFQELASRRVETNSSAVVLEAVKAGVGVAALPTAVLALVPDLVMLRAPVPAATLWVAHHRDAGRIPRVRAVVDWLFDLFDPMRNPWFRAEFVHPDEFAHLLPRSERGPDQDDAGENTGRAQA